jgi:4-hydroxy-tetrahydrodipicolinate reductase
MTQRAPVALLGAAGKMGAVVRQTLDASADFVLAVSVDAPSGAHRPDLDGIAPGGVAGILDFSSPEGTTHAARSALRLSCPLVSGTTGIGEDARLALSTAARSVPVCWSPNFSVGVTVMADALARSAALLPDGWQIEIAELHHAAKKDAPSGTAWRLAEIWKKIRGGEIVLGRHGEGLARGATEIGISALRLGSLVGEHRVFLAGPGELFELRHTAGDRMAFAAGAVEALRRLLRKGPGMYEWSDLLLQQEQR